MGDGRPWHRLQRNYWKTSSQCAIKESRSQHDSLLSKPVNSVHLSNKKSARAKELSVQRLWCANRTVTICVTHTCQRPPNEVREKALDFINQMREKVIGGNRDNRYVINMDQTPVFFDMPSGRTFKSIRYVWSCFYVLMSERIDKFTNHLPPCFVF